ncbi:MAG: hypothetical protein MJ169_09010 [Treponema sp.]|nr:hypothetical protein [Treponema sp.]
MYNANQVNGALTDLFKTPTYLAFGSRSGSLRFIDLDGINEDSVCETIVSSGIYNSINYLGLKTSGSIELIIGSEYMANSGYKVGVQLKLVGTDINAIPSIKIRRSVGAWSAWSQLI